MPTSLALTTHSSTSHTSSTLLTIVAYITTQKCHLSPLSPLLFWCIYGLIKRLELFSTFIHFPPCKLLPLGIYFWWIIGLYSEVLWILDLNLIYCEFFCNKQLTFTYELIWFDTTFQLTIGHVWVNPFSLYANKSMVQTLFLGRARLMGSSPIFLGQDLIVLIEWSDYIRSNWKLKDWKKKN